MNSQDSGADKLLLLFIPNDFSLRFGGELNKCILSLRGQVERGDVQYGVRHKNNECLRVGSIERFMYLFF